MSVWAVALKNMNYLASILLLVCCPFGIVLGEAQSPGAKSGESVLNLKIKTVYMHRDHAEFDVSLYSDEELVISVSKFGLVNALQAAQFSDLHGQNWSVSDAHVIADPPPPESDFILVVHPRQTNDISISTRAIKKTNRTDLRPDLPPTEFRYNILRKVGTIKPPGGKFSWINCQGVGTAKVEWKQK